MEIHEQIRLRAILANRTGDLSYVLGIPPNLQVSGLYPEKMGLNTKERIEEERKISKFKEKLDKEGKVFNYDKI